MSRIVALDVHDFRIPLTAPFGIAGGQQTVAHNLLVRIELDDGAVGWGEAAPFPAANGDTVQAAARALAEVRWVGESAEAWADRAAQIRALGSASARCGAEMALVDALCRRDGVPMHRWFGGAGTTVVTDVTIPTGEGALQAVQREQQGYSLLKIKVGGRPLSRDIERLRAIAGATRCDLLLDGNGGVASVEDALRLIELLDPRLVLFEQPFARGDEARMAELAGQTTVPLAADESAVTAADVERIARLGAARIVNLKFTKSGVVECSRMADVARAAGLRLMMGAMVESPLALSAAACFAAGMGGFEVVDLDTHLWMANPPVLGGFVQRGAVLDVGGVVAGHGVVPRSIPVEPAR